VSSPSTSHHLAQGVPGRGSSPSRPSTGSPSRSDASEWLGTVGWAAKGVLYLLIAVLTFQLALSGGMDADQASKQGAMQSLVDKPFGGALLVTIVIGLFAYAAYRLLAVFVPTDDDDAKKVAKKIGHLASAVAYAVFAVQGISVLMGKNKGGDTTQKTWSAVLLSSTLGTLLLLAVGIGFIAFGAWQVRRAVKRSFLDKMDCPSGTLLNRQNVGRIGVVGLLARAAVAALLGLFVVIAVIRHDPNEVRGLDGALRSVIDSPGGPAALVVTALGLAAYGVFALVCARCRRHELG
jgi:hypothetical protein